MATYLINRLPTTLLGISPLEKLYNHTPNFSSLKLFGYACFPFLHPFNRNKLDFRSKHCVFIGYNNSHRGLNCLDTSTGKVFVSRHVIFDEGIFPFTHFNVKLTQPSSTSYATLPLSLLKNSMTHSPSPQTDTTPTTNSLTPTSSLPIDHPISSYPSFFTSPSPTVSPPTFHPSAHPTNPTLTTQLTQQIHVAEDLPQHRPQQYRETQKEYRWNHSVSSAINFSCNRYSTRISNLLFRSF